MRGGDLQSPATSPAHDDSLIGRTLAGGKLIIESLIGRGGVGAVYKARHRELHIHVAVKVLRESLQQDIDFCRRFYAEALAASRLDHPNITRVIDFGQEPSGLLYLAMEHLDGVELRAVLESAGRLSAARIAELMMQTCAGLAQAHARGIVHRDIKPENIMLVPGYDDDGTSIEIVKVCDFGIAQHFASWEGEGVVAGTPDYMSPEQCRGDELDARSDVYACGVVLYELATGQVPFVAEHPRSLLNKHQFAPLVPPSKVHSDVDARLEAIIVNALAKEREDRPASMRELRERLKALLASEAPSSQPRVESVRAPSPVESEPKQDGTPAWLERGPVYSTAISEAPGAGGLAGASSALHAVALDEVARALSTDPSAWLQRFATTSDPRSFAELSQRLEPAVRALAAVGDTRALWAVAATLQGLSTTGMPSTGHAQIARQVLRVFADPAVLSGVAERLLIGATEEREHARRILADAGVAGAYGLYGARVKLAHDASIRAPFAAALVELGPNAWPVVRAALEKIARSPRAAHAATLELAEDLLLCVPTIGDASAGDLVVEYLRVAVSGVCRAATASIVRMWGDRATPLMVAMLGAEEDVVRIAGLAGLRQLDGIDEAVLPRLHAILTKRVPASEELRAACAAALAHVADSARLPALSILGQLLAAPRRRLLDEPPEPSVEPTIPREDAVTLAIARSLLSLDGGDHQRSLVAERAEQSLPPLRSQLEKLLGARRRV